MYPINKSVQPERIFRTNRNFHHNFPWAGDNSFGIVSSGVPFNPAFKVYALSLGDMSRPEEYKYSPFDSYVDEFKLKHNIGDNVNAIMINQHNNVDDGFIGISGVINRIDIEYEHNRIRVYIISDDDGQLYEIYPETIFSRDGLYEKLMNRFYNAL